MRKWTKKLLMLTLCLCMALGAASLFTACNRDKSGSSATLAAPDSLRLGGNLREDSGKLKWKTVSGAVSYEVTVNGTTYKPGKVIVYDISPYITATGNYTISVAGVNDKGKKGSASTLTVSGTKLTAPTVSTDSDEDGWFFKWTKVENASGYHISYNDGEDWDFTTDTSNVPSLFAGTYSITVKSAGFISGDEFYIDSDAAPVAGPITVDTRPDFQFDNNPGAGTLGAFSIATIVSANRYELEVDGGTKNSANGGFTKDVTNVTNLYPARVTGNPLHGDGILTESGIYDLKLVAYNDDVRITGSLVYTMSTYFLTENEIFGFDNDWGITTQVPTTNVSLSYQDTIRRGDKGKAMKVVVGNDENTAVIPADLTNRYNFDPLATPRIKAFSYWIYVEKPDGYTALSNPPELAAPRLENGNINNKGAAYPAFYDEALTFNKWTKATIVIHDNYDCGVVLKLVFENSNFFWGINTELGYDDSGIFGGYTCYIDDIFVEEMYEPEGTFDFLQSVGGGQWSVSSYTFDIPSRYSGLNLKTGDIVDVTFDFFFCNANGMQVTPYEPLKDQWLRMTMDGNLAASPWLMFNNTDYFTNKGGADITISAVVLAGRKFEVKFDKGEIGEAFWFGMNITDIGLPPVAPDGDFDALELFAVGTYASPSYAFDIPAEYSDLNLKEDDVVNVTFNFVICAPDGVTALDPADPDAIYFMFHFGDSNNHCMVLSNGYFTNKGGTAITLPAIVQADGKLKITFSTAALSEVFWFGLKITDMELPFVPEGDLIAELSSYGWGSYSLDIPLEFTDGISEGDKVSVSFTYTVQKTDGKPVDIDDYWGIDFDGNAWMLSSGEITGKGGTATMNAIVGAGLTIPVKFHHMGYGYTAIFTITITGLEIVPASGADLEDVLCVGAGAWTRTQFTIPEAYDSLGLQAGDRIEVYFDFTVENYDTGASIHDDEYYLIGFVIGTEDNSRQITTEEISNKGGSWSVYATVGEDNTIKVCLFNGCTHSGIRLSVTVTDIELRPVT